jgi:hypothetical protein
MEEELLSLLVDDKKLAHPMDQEEQPFAFCPFLAKVTAYLRQHIPFEHMDVWVPSFAPSEGDLTPPTVSATLGAHRLVTPWRRRKDQPFFDLGRTI